MYSLTNSPFNKKVTPAICEEFLKFNNFPGQRDLSAEKSRYYSDLLMEGKLRPVDISFATCPDGIRYLMNGQHVCQACVWAGKDMNATISYYRCETWEDAWTLFASFDVHSSRTQQQIFKAARGFFSDDLKEISIRILSTCGSALSILQHDPPRFNRKNRDKTEKPFQVMGCGEETLWIASFAGKKHLMKVGCVAAMIATRRKNQEKATEFWGRVASGVGFKSERDPEKRLHDLLKASRWGSATSAENIETMYCNCVAWWNAWVTGQSRKSVKVGAMNSVPAILS